MHLAVVDYFALFFTLTFGSLVGVSSSDSLQPGPMFIPLLDIHTIYAIHLPEPSSLWLSGKLSEKCHESDEN